MVLIDRKYNKTYTSYVEGRICGGKASRMLVWKCGNVGLGLCTRGLSWRSSVRSPTTTLARGIHTFSGRNLAILESIAVIKADFDAGASRRVEGPWTFSLRIRPNG